MNAAERTMTDGQTAMRMWERTYGMIETNHEVVLEMPDGTFSVLREAFRGSSGEIGKWCIARWLSRDSADSGGGPDDTATRLDARSCVT